MEEKNHNQDIIDQLRELSKDSSKTIAIIGHGAHNEKTITELCIKIENDFGIIILPSQIEIIEDTTFSPFHNNNDYLIEKFSDTLEELKQMADCIDLNDVEDNPKPPKKLKVLKNKRVPRADYGFQGRGFTNKGKSYNMRRR